LLPIAVREAEPADAEWISSFLRARWNATTQVAHGMIIDAAALPALVAGDHQGLATYRWHGRMRSWLPSMPCQQAPEPGLL
jgi:hypothetical protein